MILSLKVLFFIINEKSPFLRQQERGFIWAVPVEPKMQIYYTTDRLLFLCKKIKNEVFFLLLKQKKTKMARGRYWSIAIPPHKMANQNGSTSDSRLKRKKNVNDWQKNLR